MYNWKLYEDFVSVAEELDIKITSKDGGCLYLELPNELSRTFWAMLWTPLNKLDSHCARYEKEHYKKSFDEYGIWRVRLKDLQQNHTDFHLEFDTKSSEDGSYWMFPEVNAKPHNQITRQDIKVCVERMLDTKNFEKNVMWAKLQEPTDDD